MLLHYLGLLIVGASWLVGLYLFYRWHDKALPTISRHAASNNQARYLFAVALSVGAIADYIWFIYWFTPHLALGAGFKILTYLVIVCILGVAWAADRHGVERFIHRLAAWSMAFVCLLMAAIVCLSAELSAIPKVICIFFSLCMFAGLSVAAFRPTAIKHYLQMQLSYVVAFELVILTAAYL